MSSSSVNLMKANPHSFFSALLALARVNIKIMHVNNICVCVYPLNTVRFFNTITTCECQPT